MDDKNVLVCRIGAIGDCIIITPLINALHESGYSVYVLTSESGSAILREDPRIKKIITHKKDSIPNDKLSDYFNAVAQAYDCGKLIDLCESIEVRLALHPNDPKYKHTKPERAALCDRNYYSETIKIAEEWLKHSLPEVSLAPSLFFTKEEHEEMSGFFSQFDGKFVVLWGLSGSARQKVYPYVFEAMQAISAIHPDAHFVTVGDEPCKILETILKTLPNVTPLAGQWNIRQSLLACQYASCVISPDTGLLHGAGAFDTPKIALLTATSAENITKTFKNVYPIEAEGIGCAPCFYIIYDADTQCNLGANRMPLCMARGIPVSKIVKEFSFIRSNFPEYRKLVIA